MSEVTPESLVETVNLTVENATVIPTPIDPTLSNAGEAADAAATGAAIANVIGNLRVNTKAPVSNAITLYATDIAVSSQAGAPTISEAIESIGDRDAGDIMFDAGNQVTVADAINSINTTLDSELTEGEIDAIFDEVFGGDE